MLNAAISLAAIWALSLVALAYLVGREILRDRRHAGQGAPRWVPDPPPSFDLALVEDDEVAELDALYYDVPAGAPRAW